MKTMAMLFAAVLSTCVLAADAPAQDQAKLPEIVLSGLNAYRTDGAQAAVNVWMAGSPIERTEQPERQLRNLRRFEELYGAYKEFHPVRTVPISPTCRMVYIQLDYQKGPAFGKMLVFKTDDGWKIVNFTFNADPEALWVVSMFGSTETP